VYPSIQSTWCLELPLQQQSVLFLASRGADGINKTHPCKDVQRAYRATILTAARKGRMMEWGEKGDGFMCLSLFSHVEAWLSVCDRFFASVDSLPHHYYMHLLYGAEVVGYRDPRIDFRERWLCFYLRGVEELHLQPESEYQMNARLNDWGHEL
jgi:hypothetical protein